MKDYISGFVSRRTKLTCGRPRNGFGESFSECSIRSGIFGALSDNKLAAIQWCEGTNEGAMGIHVPEYMGAEKLPRVSYPHDR